MILNDFSRNSNNLPDYCQYYQWFHTTFMWKQQGHHTYTKISVNVQFCPVCVLWEGNLIIKIIFDFIIIHEWFCLFEGSWWNVYHFIVLSWNILPPGRRRNPLFFTPVSQSNLRYGIEFGEENLMSHNTSNVFLQKITMCLSYSNWVHL